MIAKILVLALVACICKAQSQLCGCGGSGPILSGSLPPLPGAGVGPCAGPLPPVLNLPIPGPCSTPILPNNLLGPVNLPPPLFNNPPLGPISGPLLAESFVRPSYLPPTLQPLSPPVVTPVCPTPVVTPTNVIATTLIDNSLANSLANTLQLLIVSNLIQSTLNSGATSLVADEVIRTITETPFCTTDVVYPFPEIVSGIDCYGPSVIEACSNFYGGITEVVSPVNIEPFGPMYGGIPELVCPFPANLGPYGGIPANIYGTLPELISPLQPFYGFPEISAVAAPFNSLYGCKERVSPIPPSLPFQVSEVIAPITPFSLPPNFYNGITEIVNPVTSYAPVAAEIYIPSSIPAQLTCTLSNVPASLPVVTNVNIEPMALNGFGFGNGYFC